MTDLPRLMLKPNRDAYSFSIGHEVISTDTQFGMPRQRKGAIGSVHRLSVTYLCTKAQWQYMLAFLRAYAGKAFLAYLLLDDVEPAWYECRIVGGYQASTIHEVLYSVELPLVAKSRPVNLGQDEVIVKLYEMSQDEQDIYFNHLEKLVNEDLPRATRRI